MKESKTVVEIPVARSRRNAEIRKMRNDRLAALMSPLQVTKDSAMEPRPVNGPTGSHTVEVEKNAEMAGTTTAGKTTTQEPDHVTSLYESGRLIQPPYNLSSLATLREYSSELWQCLDAMTVNIEGYGHRFVPRLDTKEMSDDQKRAIAEENAALQNFFEYVDVDEGFTALRGRTRLDIESTGNGYWEVIRDLAGRIVEFKQLPSYRMRLGRSDKEQTQVTVPILKVKPDLSVEPATITRYKRFRKFVQLTGYATIQNSSVSRVRIVWFKEFQDPREMDNTTGNLIKGEAEIKKARDEGRLANEIIHFAQYCPRSPYGMPRFIGNWLGIVGDRAAEETNYITFNNNNIPSMFVAVSNGQLTDGTITRIESFVESQIQGNDNFSKFLVLEAEGFAEGEDGGQIKLEIKPLTKEQHTDAMFQKYSDNNRDSIRRAFRLPPILVGRAEDYTRATADASVKLADEQVFAPARKIVDQFINRRLFPEMKFVHHKFRSNSPDTTDNAELVGILSSAEKTGGMTPNIARVILEDVLGRELGPVSPDINGDVPFSLQMAEAVKNEADPTEVGQQVTALKLIDKLTGGSDEVDEDVQKAVSTVEQIRSVVEKKMRKMATMNVEPHGDHQGH